MDAPDKIKKLVDTFSNNVVNYKNSNYNEAQVRQEFINPFFKTLGWDIDNEQGFAEAYKDVIHEDAVKVGGMTKAPDYSFRIGGQRKFFLEAKKPSVSIKDDIHPAYQLRRYAWSGKLPISILTDFEEFAVYDCTTKPNPNDKASASRILYYTYKDYIDKWEDINSVFSKEAVLKGSFDRFAVSSKGKKGTSGVDAEFLKSLDSWRDLLARNIVNRNNSIDEDELNYSLQKIIDRIIFLRICEDRGVEIEGQLQNTLGSDTYKRLKILFHTADQKYNSGLFDYKKDKITDTLSIDDKALKTIIEEMYYPKSPYEFSVIPVEILGHSYEQYLGKVIRITPGHRIKIEEKPEVRKAGGVYYTPQYIVDYIVKNTVGRLLEGKTADEIEKIKICDPACGSGSFLLGAYQCLLDWHREYYKNANIKKKNLYLTPEGNLTTAVKSKILLNNIYGVDIDTNAVEVTKLSLMLKAMEGETQASISNQLALLHERVLPTLDNNIKSGNSLIDIDFYDSQLDFEPGVEKKIKPFNWESSFPEVFRQGGFDVVIGNPPYGAELDNYSIDYLKRKYPIGNTDTAALFMVLTQKLLKENGYNGFIIPKPFTYASNWAKTRDILLPDITIIVDCSKVWKEVKLEMSICISQKSSKKNNFRSFVRVGELISFIGDINKNLCKEFEFILNGISSNEILIGNKIRQIQTSLNDFAINKRGLILNKFLEKGTYKVIGCKEIGRYIFRGIRGYINENLFDTNAEIKPNHILLQGIVAHIENPIDHIKLMATTLDETKNVFLADNINQIIVKKEFSNKYILGIINSQLLSWYCYRFIYGKSIRTMRIDNPVTSRILIPKIDLTKKSEKAQHDKIVELVETMLHLNKDLQNAKLPEQKEQIKSRLDYTDKKIDNLVYELYDLTEEEIRIVEGEV